MEKRQFSFRSDKNMNENVNWKPHPHYDQDDFLASHQASGGTQGFWNPSARPRPSDFDEETKHRMYQEKILHKQQVEMYHQYQQQNHTPSHQPQLLERMQDLMRHRAPIDLPFRLGSLINRQNGRMIGAKDRKSISSMSFDSLFVNKNNPPSYFPNQIPPSHSADCLPTRIEIAPIHMNGNANPYHPAPISHQRSFPGTESHSLLGSEVMSRVLIPNTKIGAVIGRGGAIVKYIRECTGARITISDVGDDAAWAGSGGPNSGERLVHIVGSFNAVCTAFGAVLAHAETPSNGEPLHGLASLVRMGFLSGESIHALEANISMPASGFRMLVPSIKVGALIGKSGSTITLIRETSRAHIEISSHQTGPFPMGIPSNSSIISPSASSVSLSSSVDRIVAVAGQFSSCVSAHYLIMTSLIDPIAVHMSHSGQFPLSYVPTETFNTMGPPSAKNIISPPGLCEMPLNGHINKRSSSSEMLNDHMSHKAANSRNIHIQHQDFYHASGNLSGRLEEQRISPGLLFNEYGNPSSSMYRDYDSLNGQLGNSSHLKDIQEIEASKGGGSPSDHHIQRIMVMINNVDSITEDEHVVSKNAFPNDNKLPSKRDFVDGSFHAADIANLLAGMTVSDQKPVGQRAGSTTRDM
eukprot:CAMPEP_0171464708 /NCGR_PEP_ID=MMETSP0945-20130129/7949_1 /TAXON_ID=109269 /ORGANISM="Vaucheria litorea, Strain CCMP2940" /LENGTH=637 /DNA_ID=CAMNT_0011991911 /DNA_START=105 /DNA_END=2018 /DNA_ORIENTATION=+